MKGDYIMSTSINVQINGQTVTIKSGERLEDIKKKLANPAEPIFEGVDANNNGKLDAGEIEKLKTNLQNNNYTVEVAEDGKTPRRAYNSAMQNLRNSYDGEKLGEYFKSDDSDLHEVKKGETLYTIAKKQLEAEGLPTNDFRAINNRIAQIANLNNINDVNNIKEGTKLRIKLTDEAIAKVKENDNDSAKAFNGVGTAQGDDWTNTSRAKGKTQVADNDTKQTGAKNNYKKQKTLVDGKTSTIEVARNGLNMGKGVPVDKDGNILKNFKDPKFKQDGCIMKYSNPNHDPQEMYQITHGAGKAETAFMFKDVKLSAPTIRELKDLEAKYEAAASKIKTAPTNETAEAKATRMATNLAALKELVALTGGNEQVIKNVAEKLRGDDYVDRESDDYKAFVQDLLLTRNADVVGALTPKDGDGNVDMSVVEKDRTSHEYLAGMYQEIRRDEIAGKKLTDEQLKLKDALVNTQFEYGFKLEADEANGVNEKYLYHNHNGRLNYATPVDNIAYYASTGKTLDKFVNKLKVADTDEKKAALFKEYANTKDVELARCLLQRAKTLKASNEDIKTVINANDMYVLSTLEHSDNADWSDDIKNAINARIKDIYTKDKGNLENARLLGVAKNWLNKITDDKQRDAIKTEIAETYFEKTTTKDENGNDQVEYTFNPNRRPTKEEMDGLVSLTSDLLDTVTGLMYGALVDYIDVDKMGKGQPAESIETINRDSNVPFRYAELVDTMTDKKEVLDFIGKISANKSQNIPYDKILEKFPDDKDIKDKLLLNVDASSTISDENRLALAKTYLKEENGKVSIDKTKLPKGATAQNILKALPNDCKTGEAEKYFKAALQGLGKDDIETLKKFADRNEKAVKARLAELVKANMGDKAFIQQVCELDDKITPYQALYEVDATKAKWDDKTKQAVFEKIYNGRNASKYLEGSVKNHLAENHPYATSERQRKRYIIGDAVYIANADKSGKVTLKRVSKAGIAKGEEMYQQVAGPGSGKISEMLYSQDGEYKNYITKDNVASLILGFYDISPNENMMQYIANESKTFSQARCNNVAKALLEKAKDVGLTGTNEYKKLNTFIDKHKSATNGYTEDEGKQLDALLNELAGKVMEKF